MAKENPLQIVEELIENVSPADPGTYALVFSHGLVDLTKHRDIPPGCEVISHLTSDQINKGLNSAQWNRIEERIRLIRKGDTLLTPEEKFTFKEP